MNGTSVPATYCAGMKMSTSRLKFGNTVLLLKVNVSSIAWGTPGMRVASGGAL